jgi:glutaredoxin 2
MSRERNSKGGFMPEANDILEYIVLTASKPQKQEEEMPDWLSSFFDDEEFDMYGR